MIKPSYLLFFTLVFTHSTGFSETAYSEFSGAESQYSTPEIKDGCPPALEKWVEDDFKDKRSWGFKYKSEASMCQSQVKSYQDFLTNHKKQNPKLSDSNKLSTFFSDKFNKKINPSYNDTIKKCNQLSPEKASAVQTRFYAAGTKLEAVNSSILEEVSYLESVLPNTKSSLNEIECSAPIWPEIKEKCKELIKATQECSSTQSKENRLNELVKKTQATIPQIQALEQAETNCKNSLNNNTRNKAPTSATYPNTPTLKSTCDSITSAIEIKKNEIPWIRGEEFLKLVLTKKPNSRPNGFIPLYDLSEDKIKNAISQQLNQNLKALKSSYKSNLATFRCLSNKAEDSNCDFEKIRTHLQALPDLRGLIFSPKDPIDNEAKTYFEAESCLLERHEDRAQTKSVVDNSMEGIALTAATFGLGAATSGVRALNSTNHIAKLRQGLLASQVGLNVALTSQELKQAYESCREETKAIIDLSKTSNLNKENICSSQTSPLAQAKEQETDCLVNTLLTAPSVLPFVGNLPALKALTSAPFKKLSDASQTSASAAKMKREKELEAFIAKVKSRGKDNRDLDFAHTLDLDERITVAESLLGKPLTSKQKEAIKKAHEAGPYDFDPNSALTKEKDKILQEAGFTSRESALLRGNGIAGGWGNWEDTVKNGFRGQTATVTRSDGSQTKATITQVIRRDEKGNPTAVRVEWPVGDDIASKVVNLEKLKIDYIRGQNVFFTRSDGSITKGTIADTITDPVTGQRKHLLVWEENGVRLEKKVSNDKVSHIPPEARSSTNQQRTASSGQQDSSGDSKNNSSKNTPPPPPPPPPRPDPKPQSSFDQAAFITPRSNNRINFATDRTEMARIVNSKGTINSLERIQQVLNLPGQPSRDEIKQEVRRRIQKYNSDQNPDYGTVTKETSDALNDMKNFIQGLERAR